VQNANQNPNIKEVVGVRNAELNIILTSTTIIVPLLAVGSYKWAAITAIIGIALLLYMSTTWIRQLKQIRHGESITIGLWQRLKENLVIVKFSVLIAMRRKLIKILSSTRDLNDSYHWIPCSNNGNEPLMIYYTPDKYTKKQQPQYGMSEERIKLLFKMLDEYARQSSKNSRGSSEIKNS